MVSCAGSNDGGSVKKDEIGTGVTGLVEFGKDDKVCVIQNWKSRSRVSYYIEGKLADDVAAKKGKIVTVSGRIIEDISKFSKRFEAERIVKVEDQ